MTATLVCVVAQRLVHRVCPDCREPYDASGEELAELGRPQEETGRLLAPGSGCVACDGTGFRGRLAIFEVLSVSDDIRGLLAGGASTAEIEQAAVAGGMRTFRESGIHLCLEGLTTVSELRRVLGAESEGEAMKPLEHPAPAHYEDEESEPA